MSTLLQVNSIRTRKKHGLPDTVDKDMEDQARIAPEMHTGRVPNLNSFKIMISEMMKRK